MRETKKSKLSRAQELCAHDPVVQSDDGWCGAENIFGVSCTRPKGHYGPHVECGIYGQVREMWDDGDVEPCVFE